MPKIPRIPKIRKTAFPDQMFMDRETGALSRYDLFPEDWAAIRRTHVPVQGPELPQLLEQRRQYLRNAQEAYEMDLAEERARQAYNRRVQAWNEYIDLPRRERKFWSNRDKLARALDDYDVPQDPSWYTKNYENFEYVPMRPSYRDADFGQAMSINPEDYPEFTSFKEFPDDLLDMPWRR